ncbi:hypothetical protein, variant [Aphanomyces astaci]|uniref:BART domain-containing protein n=1 Tax=Aphanomyces astaci TaxID=112090 RepID=W4GCZ1_APHAT|nr:hypothetical protein, variant [Aphanomyces astaci]ETV76828.1 hypothetical protein, variant [Aphanomyces astaci]|eukprot:XP_009833739.1 hypothetical protein, variant [Aphanomyces astaci]
MPSESKEAKRCAGDDDGDVKQSCSGGDSDSGAKRAKDEEFDEDNNVVTKVMTYFFENQEFNQAFQDFAERECDLFDTEDEVEMKLEYTDVFNRRTKPTPRARCPCTLKCSWPCATFPCLCS